MAHFQQTTSTTLDKRIRRIIIIVIWLLIWQLVSLAINNSILCAGPIETIKALVGMITTSSFWLTLLYSAIRITAGFIAGSIIGLVLAWFAYRHNLIAEFLSPFVSAVKSIPVASFVIIILIWVGSSIMSAVVVSLVVFPIVYLNTLEGLRSTDIKLLQMAQVFKMRPIMKLKHIYLRSLKPFLISSFSLAIGMSWKSGIAAEVIGRPRSSMGDGIYSSKIYLETDKLFAWTICAVLLAYVFERIVKAVLRRVTR